MAIKLFISTFNREVTWKNCIPIEVGAKGRDSFIYSIKDDAGDNISELNPWFGELTGIYWIWKNYEFDENDIVGFGHWNKILDISQNKVEKILGKSKNGWIMRHGESIVPHDYVEDVSTLESVLRNDYPEYYNSWTKMYCDNGKTREGFDKCLGQLWYTRVSEFNNYCAWLFDVMFKVYEKEGKVNRPKYHQRYLAFLGERLSAVYLDANKLVPDCSVNLKYKNNGGILRYVKIIAIPVLKHTPFYERLKEKYGSGSLYK